MSSKIKPVLDKKKSNIFKPKSFLSNSAITSVETPALSNAASAVAKFTFLPFKFVLT